MGVEESGSAFNKGDGTIEAISSQNIGVNEEALNGATTTSHTPTDTSADPTAPPADPNPDSSSTEEESDNSSEDSSGDEDSDVFGDGIENYGSDINEEFIEFRVEIKSFQIRKRKKRAHADPENVSCGVVGPDLGFDETETGKKSLEGRIGGDETYYPSSDACSFETDEDECWVENGEEVRVNLPRRRSSTKKVVYDPTAKNVMWKLGMIFADVNEFRDAGLDVEGDTMSTCHSCMYYKGYEPADYVDNYYMKETYLMTYSHFLQPLNNMEMWPASTNPHVAPPVVKSMPGRPKKVRRKEATETKKCGKLPKSGLVMRCGIWKGVGHNKRGCHKSATDPSGSGTVVASSAVTSTAAETSGSGRNRGRPKKLRNVEDEPAAKRGRGRPRKSTSIAPNVSVALDFSSSITSAAAIHQLHLLQHLLHLMQHLVQLVEPGMPSSRIIATPSTTGPTMITRSVNVTGDIGYKPSGGLKWKWKQVITTRRLQEIRGQHRIQTRTRASYNLI